MIRLPSEPIHEALPENKPYRGLDSLVNQNFVVPDVVLQKMSQNELSQSDLRRSSSDNSPNHAPYEESVVTVTGPGLPDTCQLDCGAEQNRAISTARENAIASLIVLANLVPVY